MKFHFVKASILASVFCICAAAMAENPFVGTWKLDPSQSKLTGQTFSFAPEPGGKVRSTSSGVSYVFALDGSETTNPVGLTEVWTKINDNTWKSVTTRSNAKASETDQLTLSEDGNGLNVVSDGTKPNGDAYHETASFTRVAAGQGFFGTWKSTSVSANSPDTMVIDANGDDGVILRLPQWKSSITLTFDGKEASIIGPDAPKDLTWSATRTGARAFSEVGRLKGKIVDTSVFTISDDGKTMTEVDTDANGSATTSVYKKS